MSGNKQPPTASAPAKSRFAFLPSSVTSAINTVASNPTVTSVARTVSSSSVGQSISNSSTVSRLGALSDAMTDEDGSAHKVASKIRDKVGKVTSGISRLGVSVATTWNPNHRHDEAHEQEIDAKLMAIRDSHRFRSFAPDRPGNIVKWHIDGHDYFWALSELIDSAKESIMILDWWLSPELQLRRPAAFYPEWRLDRLLLRKANEGVKIYIQVYKEVTASMSLGSKHTKHALEDWDETENIAVMRHPDHSGGELVYYFSHHEKLCVIDCKVAAMGGLDACFGRWDTQNHPMADVHPTQFEKSLFPGQDYNNSRIMDFQTVDKWASNALAIQDAGRMPWHDTSLTIMGPSVVDLVQHFCERWNFVKALKYKHDHRMDWLQLPSPWDSVQAREQAQEAQEDAEFRAEHPHLAQWKELGKRVQHPYHSKPGEPRASEDIPQGTCRVQVLRSSADWSHGILTEDSIQQAYIELIREANHTIYIENQFFITTTQDKGPIKNLIGLTIVERILSAAKAGRKFKVYVCIPEVPAFPGDIQGDAGLKAIMEAQYRSICRGGNSIFDRIRKEGYDPHEYISFSNLRSYDRINSPPSLIKKMEADSGVTFHEAQVALTRLYVGDPGGENADKDAVVFIEKAHDPSDKGDDSNKKGKTAQDTVPLPKTTQEAVDIIQRFQAAAPREDLSVADNICQDAFQSGKTVLEESWAGTPEEELACIVSEQCYIHSKLMIVDDRRVIVGSANLNDRSQVGSHDSEIAVVIEDMEMIETTMNGQKYMASKLATSWRRSLMREHLGLMAPPTSSDPNNKEFQPTIAMRPAPIENEYDWASEADLAVADPLSPEFERLWNETGKENRRIFERIFRPVPTDMVHSWAEYKPFVDRSANTMVGHVANPDMSIQEVKAELSKIRGHLVTMPLNFLRDEKWMTDGEWLAVNPITLAIYI